SSLTSFSHSHHLLHSPHFHHFFFISTSLPLPPRPPLFPYTTLFRSREISRSSITRISRRINCKSRTSSSRCTVIGRMGSASTGRDRKSTRLNSSHVSISYAVFCLKKKNIYKYVINNIR